MAWAVDSAKLIFGNAASIIQDKRLRECNYGDLNGADSKRVHSMAKERIITPFPNGESYVQVEERMRQFIQELQTKYAQKRIAIVAHQAPPT